MGFLGTLLGTDQQKMAQQAAEDTYNKQQGNIRALLGYGDQYASGMRELSNNYNGAIQQSGESGTAMHDALMRLMQNPSSVRDLPGYQFNMDQGVRALDASGAARGMTQSGRQSKDLMRFGQGLADQTYGNWFDRFQRGEGQAMGQNLQATGMKTNTIGQGLQGQFGAQNTAYQGGMQSAGTVGQGIVAGGNALSAGMQNLMNLGSTIGGWYFGGGKSGGGSSFGGGGSGGK